jgi:release factor glutamine methyltransferase
MTPPGVFHPISDSWLLARVLCAQPQTRGGAVLDLCTGSGVLAVSAARCGAAEAVAVDVSRRAVAVARLNARLNGVRVRAVRGDLYAPVAGRRFDVIVSNPPYVPSATDALPRRGLARAWDAGRHGRVLLDRIIEGAPAHLKPGGVVLLVHSDVIDLPGTVALLEQGGLTVDTAVRRHGPLGPLLSARRTLLEERGLLEPGQDHEELCVVRARARH